MHGTLAFTLLFNGLIAPALAGAGAVLLAHKWLRGRELATSMAAIAGMLCVYGNQFTWPPLQAMDWLILFSPLFALPGLLCTGVAAYWTGISVISLIAAYLILHPALRFASSPLLLIAAAGILWSAYLASHRTGNADHGETAAHAGATLVLAIIVTAGGSALLGQLLAALGAATLGLLLLVLITKQPRSLLPMRAATFGVGLIAMVYAEINVVLLAIPLMLAIASAYLARRYASSLVATEGLAFVLALVFSAPIWGTALARRISGPAIY